MLQLSHIRENRQEVISRLAIKNIDATAQIDSILELDEKRRMAQNRLDSLLAEVNKTSREIGILIKDGKKEVADELRKQIAANKENITEHENDMAATELQLQNELVLLPNMPHPSVPKGKTPADNEVVFSWGNAVGLGAEALPHWELAAKYNLIDFELGVKITGAGFPVYLGKGARLQRALINFFLDEALKQGYQEVQPPIFINAASGFGTGQLPDKEGQMYYVTEDDLYAIPTAEVPITNLYRNELLKESDLPIRNVGYTPCFRREAGSYGKDVRGLNRLHQFDKVEIVHIAKPEESYEHLENMRLYVQSLLEKLELPYRVLKLCGGDMSFASALTYDMEVYSAGQQRWLEVSSVSNFEAFQSNRLKCRYKNKEGKNQLVHTLNGSALALPRIVAAMLEKNQTENGILVPQVLQAYTGFELID
jgi:seryl-tRNA synthetase